MRPTLARRPLPPPPPSPSLSASLRRRQQQRHSSGGGVSRPARSRRRRRRRHRLARDRAVTTPPIARVYFARAPRCVVVVRSLARSLAACAFLPLVRSRCQRRRRLGARTHADCSHSNRLHLWAAIQASARSHTHKQGRNSPTASKRASGAHARAFSLRLATWLFLRHIGAFIRLHFKRLQVYNAKCCMMKALHLSQLLC